MSVLLAGGGEGGCGGWWGRGLWRVDGGIETKGGCSGY